MKPRILAIETATTACSVALTCNGTISHRFEIVPQLHTQRVFPMIRALLEEACLKLADIDAIAVGRGPGSFTGLRIAVSIAQGLGYGLNKRVYPISTLEAMALQATKNLKEGQSQLVLTSIDARMQEVYAALYRVFKTATIEVVTSEHLIAIEAFKQWQNELSESVIHIDAHPRAKEVAILALAAYERGEEGIAPEDVLPVYLRDKVAEIPKAVIV